MAARMPLLEKLKQRKRAQWALVYDAFAYALSLRINMDITRQGAETRKLIAAPDSRWGNQR